MSQGFEAVAAAFLEMEPRLVVVDWRVRETVGAWNISTRIPVETIIGSYEPIEELWSTQARLRIPLHEESTAKLTGEFLEYRIDQPNPCIVYYDFSRGSRSRLTIDEFGRSYLAWRVRFWHSEFEPPETPQCLVNSSLGSGQNPTISEQKRIETRERSPEGFFSELRYFVGEERQAERKERESLFQDMEFSTFGTKFPAIEGLKTAGRTYDEELGQICTLYLPEEEIENSSISIPDKFGIFQGMEVLIRARGNPPGFPVRAKLETINENELDLGIYWDSSPNKEQAERAFKESSKLSFQMGALVNPVPYDRQLAAIDAVEEDEKKSSIVTGAASPALAPADDVTLHPRALNEYQQAAIRNGLRASDVYCIHGPPGTGKTRTLTALIKSLVEANNRVLACAHSNQAVDNLLFGNSTVDTVDQHSLHAAAVDDELTLSRAGQNSEHDLVDEIYGDIPPWEAQVVGTTTNRASKFRMNEFDIAVIDEATQATIPSSLIPYSKAEKLLLAGDHKQLPPYVSGEHAEEQKFEISLFEHLVRVYGSDIRTVLKKQYRMNQKIVEFPNALFYDGALVHGERNRNWTIRDLPPIEGVQVSGAEKRTPGNSYYNEAEIAHVKSEVDQLLNHGVRASDIGIITPYSGQAGKISVEIEEVTPEAEKITVSTVDAFQGAERDAIVISFVRSNDDGEIGFLSFPDEGPRRLNVAMTRARKRCVLIGDWDTLRGGRQEKRQSGAQQYYAQLRQHLSDEGVLHAGSSDKLR